MIRIPKLTLKYLILFPIIIGAFRIGLENIFIVKHDLYGIAIKRGSYSYWVLVPSLLKDLPLVGLAGDPEFRTYGTVDGPDWEEVHYPSIEAPAFIQQHIEEYLMNQGFAPCYSSLCIQREQANGRQIWVSSDPENVRSVEIAIEARSKPNGEKYQDVWVGYFF